MNQTVQLLKEREIKAEIRTKWDGVPDSSIGILLGKAKLTPGKEKLLPGAFADHLTSFAGVFGNGSQTTLDIWLRNGAAASAGTVVEPRAMWMKFPHAHLFLHYTAGCTLIESLYQSIYSPLEILLVGDPLVQPWKSPERLTGNGFRVADAGEVLNVEMTVIGPDKDRYNRFELYVDGRPAGTFYDHKFQFVMPERSKAEFRDVRVVAGKSGRIRTRLTYRYEEEKP